MMDQCVECGRITDEDALEADGLPFCSHECRAVFRRGQALAEFERGQYDEYTGRELQAYWPDEDYPR